MRKNFYDGVEFDAGILTNIRPNGIFKNWIEHARIKRKFFDLMKSNSKLIVNADEKNIKDWINSLNHEIEKDIFVFDTSLKDILDFNIDKNKVTLNIDSKKTLEVPLIGKYAVKNVLLAIELLKHYISDEDQIYTSLCEFSQMPLPLTVVQSDPFHIIVDTQKILEYLVENLSFLKQTKDDNRKLISVVGSPESHKQYRGLFGDTVLRFSDVVILAPDDPEEKDTFDINTEIVSNIQASNWSLNERITSSIELDMLEKEPVLNSVTKNLAEGVKSVFSFDGRDSKSRFDAIRFALALAEVGDIVYIGGKGGDDKFKSKKIENWSDYAAIAEALSVVN